MNTFGGRQTRTRADLKLDVLQGLHAGIPECCVEFFVSIAYATSVSFVRAFVREALDQSFCWGYVTCPRCYDAILAGRETPAIIHECTSGDSLACTLLRVHEIPDLITALRAYE